MAEALLHAAAGVLLDLGEAGAAGVVVAVGAVPHLAAEQLIERHAGALALDVPQRDVDAAHRVEEHAAVPPVRAHVARLPDVLDLVDVAADQERLQILLDRGLHDQRALGEGRAAPADQPGLGRLDLHDDEADPVRRGEDGLDVADLDRSGPAHRLRVGGRRAGANASASASFDASSVAPPPRAIEPSRSRRFIGVSFKDVSSSNSQLPSSKAVPTPKLPIPRSQAPNSQCRRRWRLAVGSALELELGSLGFAIAHQCVSDPSGRL